jgi:AcrR family transcriptional regulator
MIRSVTSPASRNPDARATPRAGANPARRSRILDAGERLFSRGGVRGVTMEAVAAEARVAKATLYSYFRDREALFAAVAERLAATLLEAFGAGLAESGGPRRPDERIAAALVAKHRLVFALVHGSPHARELLSEKERLAPTPFEEADARMIAQLEAVLARDGALSARAGATARALFWGAAGLAEHAAGADALAAEIRDFVCVHLRGARMASRSAR